MNDDSPGFKVGDVVERKGLRLPELTSVFPDGPPACVIVNIMPHPNGGTPLITVQNMFGQQTYSPEVLQPWLGTDEELARQIATSKLMEKSVQEIHDMYEEEAMKITEQGEN